MPIWNKNQQSYAYIYKLADTLELTETHKKHMQNKKIQTKNN